ncbi:MAG TPA: 50S ribosomal protein L18, partial [Bacilli bacterium]|nr:50S ribosomal protein L18 [Bacilli bacterium]
MIIKESRAKAREVRHQRLRQTLSGTSERPRLAVFRSNKNIAAQIIDDEKSITLVSASTIE